MWGSCGRTGRSEIRTGFCQRPCIPDDRLCRVGRGGHDVDVFGSIGDERMNLFKLLDK
mgnify:CR=1 FL=1